MYRNPYNRETDPENWRRWNVGEEDGSRGMPKRGTSVAYRNGYNFGVCHRALFNAANWVYKSPEKRRPS